MGRLAPSPDPDEAAEPDRAAPQVFVRTFIVPPGLPWDQGRAAALEARHGSPLPISDLLHRLRRQATWAPGAPGLYAAFYVRRKDYSQPFETVVDVDGARVSVAFGTTAGRSDQARRLAVAVAVGLALMALVVAPVGVAMTARGEAAQRLEGLETRLAVRSRQAARLEQARVRMIALAHARGEAGTPQDVVADLGWIGRAKAADARIVAVHWEGGLIAIEARGEGPPLTTMEREVVRSDKPLRPGVWLWGVARSPKPAIAAPAVAEAVGP